MELLAKFGYFRQAKKSDMAKKPLIPYISLRPQPYPHAGAVITMTLKGAVKLVWACIKLIFKRNYDAIAIDAYNSDGEKYDLTIVCVGECEMQGTIPYYTDWEVEKELMCRDPLNPTTVANNPTIGQYNQKDIEDILKEANEHFKQLLERHQEG